MSIEDEAKEIYNKFSNEAGSYIEGKQCALLCVDYLIKHDLYNRQRWEIIKQEISEMH